MKKLLLSVGAVLFLGSCSDLSVSENESLESALPKDFNWQTYIDINNDVRASQIIFKIQEKYGDINDTKKPELKQKCTGLLASDLSFAGEVYVSYAGCPEQGWDKENACTEKVYANNDHYNLGGEFAQTCDIPACSDKGWLALKAELEADNFANKAVNTICAFMPLEENAAQAKQVLEGITIDSLLVKQHYFLLGKREGRPYKYCEGNTGEQRNRNSHAKRSRAGSGQDMRVFYDYSQYLFCFDKTSEKIYVMR